MSLSDASHGPSQVTLSELYRSHSKWLSTRLRHLGVESPDDVVQETYLRIAPYQARGEVRHPKSLLLRIATNLVAEEGRRTQRQRRHAATAPLWTDAPTQTEAVLLKQLVLKLPQPERDIFMLSRFGSLTNEQIAARLDLSVKTVERRITRALKQVDAQLRR
ncbi:RNA polymerase sigma factor [Brevundimonas sp. P7753]|uniref:RNA polymerase sigma factor n=1 Tax=Brevundimonas sp. P7753 TaxID=2726982 RepID=UPI0015BD0CE6|nr:RNA polymerase sigma factor [Brevundimonas sp. P7753]NWE53821.1 RNA polymerase sigma factor [Brevundimonas sp. P7753]